MIYLGISTIERKKMELYFPILGEDALALTASVSYLLEDTNFCIKAYSGTGKTVFDGSYNSTTTSRLCSYNRAFI